jgi:prepilin-type N-terminal cleavage/methylation domain-containing protein
VTRLRDERGFTMAEMLAALLISGIVLAGVNTLMQTVLRQSTTIVSKTDASQRGRLVMDRMTRELRSQVCLDLGYLSARPALEAADKNSITFFTDLSDGTQPPVKRQISYDTTKQRILEKAYPLTSAAGTRPTAFSTTPTSTVVLLDNVVPNASTGALFSYGKYTSTKLDATEPVAAPVASTDLATVARITISMDVRPANSRTVKPFTRLEDSVLIRNLNKNPDYSPTNADALRCE